MSRISKYGSLAPYFIWGVGLILAIQWLAMIHEEYGFTGEIGLGMKSHITLISIIFVIGSIVAIVDTTQAEIRRYRNKE